MDITWIYALWISGSLENEHLSREKKVIYVKLLLFFKVRYFVAIFYRPGQLSCLTHAWHCPAAACCTPWVRGSRSWCPRWRASAPCWRGQRPPSAWGTAAWNLHCLPGESKSSDNLIWLSFLSRYLSTILQYNIIRASSFQLYVV